MTSVLDQMTAGIQKQAKAKLSPVGGEEPTPVARIPGDVPGVLLAKEGLADVAADLRRQAQLLLDVAEGLDVVVGVPAAKAVFDAKQAATEVKLREREADRKVADGEVETIPVKAKTKDAGEQFEADLAAKAAAAQAAVFAAADAGADEEEEPAPAGAWVCPTHGDAALATLTARGGRKYKACNKCDAFEPKQ